MGNSSRYAPGEYATRPVTPQLSAGSILWRVIVTGLIGALIAMIQVGVSTTGAITLGRITGSQFANSDDAFITMTGWLALFRGADNLIWSLGALTLVLLWWRPVKVAFRLMAALALALVLLLPPPAEAYYSKTDYADPFFILPSESAFFIPDVGANKDSQASFGSEQYLKENKIAAKRFNVTHVKLPATGGYLESDYYVPTGRLIILDRTPVNREWVAAAHRGTSTGDQSFPCQTSEGLDYKVGIAISAFVTEDNAAKFLYWFGVNAPAGDRSKPEVIFTSVYYARSLSQIMDTVVRSKVQALVCTEVVKRTLDKANGDMAAMMTGIEVSVKAYMDSRGISLDFVGWADTAEFDHAVQTAINRRYIADKDAAIAAQLGPVVGTLQAVAAAEATRTFATKWNGALPAQVSLWWLPESISNFFTSVFKTSTPSAPK